mmetsp:Transcript_130140/g.376517  ORF Transcript_130140/g.376517 Transcript_130140/m.376517 type:complete len:380 (+) Transcript_130140:108-1247(+)
MPKVQFAPSVDEDRPSQKRQREASLAEQEEDAGQPPKKPKRYSTNEDEIDDIDDWKEEVDGDAAEDEATIPSEKELLDAKRQRRQNRAGLDADGTTHIDERTSLAAEGVAIEPFHMRNEESDGTGFFDGDTYVFRKHNVEEGEDEEPDAWLDRLKEDEAEGKATHYQVPEATKKVDGSLQGSMDDLTKEELYQRIVPLLGPNETVSQALVRYGRLIKASRKSNGETKESTAKGFLDEVTGAANALLLKGDVEIYQSTKDDIQRRLPSSQFNTSGSSRKRLIEKQPPAQWEYRGNQDGALHGPYTTEQMLSWVKAGYFVGPQKVQIRTIREEPKELSTKEDLLNDLMDDDEDGGEGEKETVLAKGEWQWSSEVDFDAYLP